LALSPLAPPAWIGVRLSTSDGFRQIAGAVLLTLTYLVAVVIVAGVLSLTYRHLVLSRGLAADESTELSEQPDPAAEAGARGLAPRVTLLDRDPAD